MTDSTPPDGVETRWRLGRSALAAAVAALALAAAGATGIHLSLKDTGADAASAAAHARPDRKAGTWQRTPVAVEKGDITAVAALNERQAWAVGYRMTSDTQVEALALRWNGTAWKQESTLPEGSFPQALAVRSADDIWAGGVGTAHWDGSKWTSADPQQDPGGRVMPEALTDTKTGGVWMAGRAVPQGVKNGVPAVQLWKGSRWQRQSIPDVGKGELTGITAVAKDDVWAAGTAYAADGKSEQTPLLLHWDGTSWKRVDAPGAKASATWITGVTAVAKDDVWAVGGRTATGGDRPFALHWDGKNWQSTPAPEVVDGRLRTVGRAGDGTVWAVGGKGAVSVALRWNSGERRWEKAAAPDVVVRGAATVPGSGTLWAVGIDGEGDLVPRIARLTG